MSDRAPSDAWIDAVHARRSALAAAAMKDPLVNSTVTGEPDDDR
ncbi:MAG TPA: hypothetical protein VHA73_05530 [Acidimicrobiales bacterium]|nr:hypothetical protein [Acidimicrobiales bacterium]